MPLVLWGVVILFLTSSLEILEPPCRIKAEKQGEAKCFSRFLCKFPERATPSPQICGQHGPLEKAHFVSSCIAYLIKCPLYR